MTTTTGVRELEAASSTLELLRVLKDLKNAVIGNTWKKVEVAEDEQLLDFLLGLLRIPSSFGYHEATATLEIVSEAGVIIGALSNAVGSLTLRPLLVAQTPQSLLQAVKAITSPTFPSTQVSRLLAPLLRALRNLLISTADLLWGHMWGVGAEKRVVSTGIEDGRTLGAHGPYHGKGKAVAGRGQYWEVQASTSLNLVFEEDNLDILLSLMELHPETQTLLPLYQLYARLTILPAHRRALSEWRPHSSSTSTSPPYLLEHLLLTVSYASPTRQIPGGGPRPNPKLLDAALDLLASLINGETELAVLVRGWSLAPSADEEDEADQLIHPSLRGKEAKDEVLFVLGELIKGGPTGVRIAAAGCCVNILKAAKGATPTEMIRISVHNRSLLDDVSTLLRTEGTEEHVKLCFVLASLVSDDAHLQKVAHDRGVPSQLIDLLHAIPQPAPGSSDVSPDFSSRSLEAILLALAACAMQHEPTRSTISEAEPPVLPVLKRALSHSSYGVRAAACQLARALSRTVAILRTSLVDSGVGAEILECLKREVDSHRRREVEAKAAGRTGVGAGTVGERAWTVEVAATATLCNLIADFSPLKAVLLKENGLLLLALLTHSSHEPLALNALWALKNLSFHALDPLKVQITHCLTFPALQDLLAATTSPCLRVQAMEITQNLLADGTSAEIARVVDGLGETPFLDSVEEAVRPRSNLLSLSTSSKGRGEKDREAGWDVKVPALYVVSNLALGGDRMRSAIVARVGLLEALSEALNAPTDPPKVPALRAYRHLLELPSTHKPRQAILEVLQPYHLKSRTADLRSSPSLDVAQAATALYDILERGKDTGSPVAARA